MKNNLLLLKTLFLSTSQINAYKYCKDKKKRSRLIGAFIGYAFLYIIIMAFCLATCIGYGFVGLIDAAPVMCALILSVLAFFFTLLKTNGYLFNFKEYDMLMCLPFKPKTIAGCKFLYMYIKSFPWYLSVTVAVLIGYAIYAKPALYVYPIWIVLGLLVPIIPMLVATFLGFIIAKISSGSRYNKALQVILSFVLIFLCFSSRFFFEDMFQNNKVKETLTTVSDVTGKAADIYLPAKWFTDAVIKTDIIGIALLVGISIALFIVIFLIVGSSYRKINSAFASHASSKKFVMSTQKQKSIVNSIAYKEFKRFLGSPTYMVNVVIGEVFAFIFGVVVLVMGFNNIVKLVTNNAPFDPAIIQPAIPFIIYFFIGMVATTTCSPSLEGKNYWILQSLPLEKKKVYQGKMLFNMYLTVPFTVFAVLCTCISARVPILDSILYLLLGIVLCAFSTTWGCVCGVKFMKLEWENEVEVVKQGTAVLLYLFPNMFSVMILTVLSVVFGTFINHCALMIIFILLYGALSLVCYIGVMRLAKK